MESNRIQTVTVAPDPSIARSVPDPSVARSVPDPRIARRIDPVIDYRSFPITLDRPFLSKQDELFDVRDNWSLPLTQERSFPVTQGLSFPRKQGRSFPVTQDWSFQVTGNRSQLSTPNRSRSSTQDQSLSDTEDRSLLSTQNQSFLVSSPTQNRKRNSKKINRTIEQSILRTRYLSESHYDRHLMEKHKIPKPNFMELKPKHGSYDKLKSEKSELKNNPETVTKRTIMPSDLIIRSLFEVLDEWLQGLQGLQKTLGI